MKKILYLLLISSAISLCGCQKYSLDATDVALEDGTLRVPLNIALPNTEVIETRSDADSRESKIDTLYVAVFQDNASGTLCDNAPLLQLAKATNIAKSGSAFVILKQQSVPCKIRVYANISTSVAATMNNYKTTSDVGSTPTTAGQVKDLTDNLSAIYKNKVGSATDLRDRLPMSTKDILLTDGINASTSLDVPLSFCFAKITVNATSLLNKNYTLLGVTLVNGSTNGYYIAQTPLKVNSGTAVRKYDETLSVGGGIVSPIYLYANGGNSGNNPTQLVIKGEFTDEQGNKYIGYHKINVRYNKKNGDGTTQSTYTHDIERNVSYNVNISKVQSAGYKTYDEAKNAAPANYSELEYDIYVGNSPSSDFVIGNGEYYIGVSNSEYIVYSDANQSNLVLATLTLNKSSLSSVNMDNLAKSLTATGDGLTVVPLTYWPEATLIDIYINITSAFVSGKVEIRVGNLAKTIKVSRKSSYGSMGGINSDFANSIYGYGEFVGGKPDWIRLGTSSTIFSTSDRLSSIGNGIYIYSAANTSSTFTPKAELILSRNGIEGRVKATIFQNKSINPGSMGVGGTPISNRTYTGAFWRANESGERVIRIPVENAANLGAWNAEVIWLDDRWTDKGAVVLCAPNINDMTIPTQDALPAADNSWIANTSSSSVAGNVTTNDVTKSLFKNI